MIWEGQKYTHEAAMGTSGIAHINCVTAFSGILNSLMGQDEHIYLNSNDHLKAILEMQTHDAWNALLHDIVEYMQWEYL